MPKISLIIPAYNVDRWLSECLNSVLAQSLEDWEAIIIDDASTDESAKIAAQYAAKDNRFKLIRHAENKGLGGARNTGCKAANGDYLYFLDSDDLLPSSTLEDMHNLAISKNADVVIGDFYEFQDNKEEPKLNEKYPTSDGFKDVPKTFNWRDIKDNYALLMPSIYSTTCCGKLFNKKLWDSLGCHVPKDLRMAEDFIPVKKIFFSAERITTYDNAALLYRKRKGSATTKRSEKAFEIIRAYPHAVKMFQEIGLYEELYEYIDRFFIDAFLWHMQSLLSFSLWWKFYQETSKILVNMEYSNSYKNLARWKKGSVYGFITIIISFLPYAQGMRRLLNRIIGKSRRVLNTLKTKMRLGKSS